MTFVWDDAGDLGLRLSETVELGKLSFSLRLAGKVLGPEDFLSSSWEPFSGTDAVGRFWGFRRRLFLDGAPFLEIRALSYGDVAKVEGEFLTEVQGVCGSLDFQDPAVIFPEFRVPPGLSFFLCTFGLDGAYGEHPGGYWPKALFGRVPDFPRKPFAPVVLFDGEAAVALAPGELFLGSPLLARSDRIGRALAGDFPTIPRGTVLSLLLAAGPDPGQALARLGHVFLSRSGKSRPDPQSTPLLSRLGYWNAYGSYYTELIRPMEERTLLALAAEFREKRVPVGYFGLDLWYPYRRIGQALEFRPDKKKYPRGLAAIARETGIPFVLHLSALSPENAYGADGADPAGYEEIASELQRQGAIAVWHDWLRTWQFLTKKLLSDPWAAEAWFSGMAKVFRAVGLPVLLCMQTMGMVLASAAEANVVAARSYTDHLFSLRLALREAARRTRPEIVEAWVRPVEIWVQNLLVGLVEWAFGLAPFHDLFLTREHPGFGGEHAQEEAVLRALSCGPVGFGDQLGLADQDLLRRFILPEGTLAHPDRPPFPVLETLGADLQAFWTLRQAGEATWVYYLVLNTAKEPLSLRFDPPLAGEFLVWDVLNSRVAFGINGQLAPGRLAYFVLAPLRAGIAPLGLADKFVPAGFVRLRERCTNFLSGGDG